MKRAAQFVIALVVAIVVGLCPVVTCAAPLPQHHCCPAKKHTPAAQAGGDCHLCQFVDTSQSASDAAPAGVESFSVGTLLLASSLERPSMPAPVGPPSPPRLIPLRI
jgi:hypothetical protein